MTERFKQPETEHKKTIADMVSGAAQSGLQPYGAPRPASEAHPFLPTKRERFNAIMEVLEDHFAEMSLHDQELVRTVIESGLMKSLLDPDSD